MRKKTQQRDILFMVTVSSTARIPKKVIGKFADDDCPDDCFLSDLVQRLYNEEKGEQECEEIGCETINDGNAVFCKTCGKKLDRGVTDFALDWVDWYGKESGDTFYDIFVKQIVPHITGRFEAIVFLDEESYEKERQPTEMFGVIIEDGSYTECDVSLSFSPRARQHS